MSDLNAIVAMVAIASFSVFAIWQLVRWAEDESVAAGEPMESDGWLK